MECERCGCTKSRAAVNVTDKYLQHSFIIALRSRAHITGWGSQNAHSTSWLFWSTLHGGMPPYLGPIVPCRWSAWSTIAPFCCLWLSCRATSQTVSVSLSWLLLPNSGTVCLTASLPPTDWRTFGIISSIICSRSPIPMLLCDCLYCDTHSGHSGLPLRPLRLTEWLIVSKRGIYNDRWSLWTQVDCSHWISCMSSSYTAGGNFNTCLFTLKCTTLFY